MWGMSLQWAWRFGSMCITVLSLTYQLELLMSNGWCVLQRSTM